MSPEPDAPTAPETLPKYLADGLTKQDVDTLEDVKQYADALIEHQQRPVTVDELPDGAEPVNDQEGGAGTIVKERVKCGADCTCNEGQGHGPYKYRYFRDESGNLTSEYIGKA